MTREPIATHRLAHVSDTHFTASGRLRGVVRPADAFRVMLQALEETGLRFDALVHTGDVADAGEPEAYRAVRRLTEPAAARGGWRPVWTPGNHDLRAPFREHLLGAAPSEEPLEAVHDVRGLRVVVLDTSLPGRAEGGIAPDCLDRLRAVLAEPAEHGTVLALHHPPLPVEVSVMARLHLTGQDALAAAIAGTDVRAILGGHLHTATTSTFAEVPVFVAPASAYTIRLVAPGRGIVDVDGGRAAAVLSLYDDGRVGWSLLPTDPAAVLARAPEAAFAELGVEPER